MMLAANEWHDSSWRPRGVRMSNSGFSHRPSGFSRRPCLLSIALFTCFAIGMRATAAAALTYVMLPASKAAAAVVGGATATAGAPLPVARLLLPVEESVRDYVGLAAPSTLKRIHQRQTARKTIKVRLKLQFGGYDVYGSGYVAETSAGESLLYGVSRLGVANGAPAGVAVPDRVANSTISSAAAISATAIAFGVSAASATRRIWNQEARLIYYPVKGDASSHRLCYMVKMYVSAKTQKSVIAPHAIVDATSGQILSSWNGLAAQVAVNGVGGNSGLWGLQRYPSLPVSVLDGGVTCFYNSSEVQVQNLKSATSGSFVPHVAACSQLANASFDTENGGYAPLNDIARNAKVTLDMYRAYTGIASPTGSLPLLARGHYGQRYENAFWDGRMINVGDGDVLYYPLTSLDVIAHEFSHGFTAAYSGLQYYGQAGGINEAFSDMAGEAAEFYQDGTNDFVTGRLITKSGTGVRFMCSPVADGRSIDSAASFTPSMDPHFSAGVFNKAFCRLATSPGWTTAIAFQVFAVANAIYWHQLTNFTAGACGVLSAAQDLNVSTTAVAAAFASVGLAC